MRKVRNARLKSKWHIGDYFLYGVSYAGKIISMDRNAITKANFHRGFSDSRNYSYEGRISLTDIALRPDPENPTSSLKAKRTKDALKDASDYYAIITGEKP